MKEIQNEELLLKLVKAVKFKRVRDLEEQFFQWDEFTELDDLRKQILKMLEQQFSKTGKDILFQYDDAYSLLVTKSSDYFYEKGFQDCLQLLEGSLGEIETREQRTSQISE